MYETIQTMSEKTDDEVGKHIRAAYESLKDGKAGDALDFLKQALAVDFEHPEVLYALKCLNWWIEKIKRLDEFQDHFERGEYILSQWKPYYVFLDRIFEASSPAESYDNCQYAIKRFVFIMALEYFTKILGDGNNQQDPVLLLQAGRCCKGAGNWENALKYLEQAGGLKKDDSAILSELADINALLGDERAAKVLFREAFFLDPPGIDLEAMESEMIICLRDRVGQFGYQGRELAEWIPVWGSIWGIFSVKRELKPVELGRLKQSILSMENEYRSKKNGDPILKPRLLNRYFWLIDHCEQNRDTAGLVDETMLKIKFIDPAVYDQYKT